MAKDKIAHWKKGESFSGYGPDSNEVCQGFIVWKDEKGTCESCGKRFRRPKAKKEILSCLAG